MPPYSSSARLVYHDNDGDGRKNYLGQDHWNRALGFTAPLIESIFKSKSLLQGWIDNEKSEMNLRAESYRESLGKQESIIKSQVAELAIVQRERGMNNEMLKDTNGTSNDNNSDKDHPENIAEQRESLEEESTKVRTDIMKLKTERDNREKRVQDIALEESKQRIRAIDAAALKRTAEESKQTTIDDLTRGVVNYKKLGLDFSQTGRDAELQFNFTEIDLKDPSRISSFVLVVNDDEKYDIINCEPKIDAIDLVEILEELNGSGGEDISILARRMRRAFKKVL